jgi:hypothetical protein
MNRTVLFATWIAALCAIAPATAQDSISKLGCLPGDCVEPWADSVATFGSEQVNRFVVDLSPFNTSWGTTFGVAPIAKASRTAAQFTGSLLSSQAMSRRALRNVPFPAPTYEYWNTPGAGVNNDPAVNDPTTPMAPPAGLSVQQAAAFAEFSNTAGGASYNGIVSTLINISPTAPSRLFVTRTVAAINGCDTFSNTAQFGLGSIDAQGVMTLRADDFGTAGSNCVGLVNLIDDNVFKIATKLRNPAITNVFSNDYVPGGLFDKGVGPNFTTEWLIRNSPTAVNVPGIAASGATPLLIGTDQGSGYVRGTAFGSITTDATHLATGSTNHRGNISYTPRNHASVLSTNGVCGVLGLSATNRTTILNIWGINATGGVTGKLALNLPATVTDNATGATNLAGNNEFDNYQSQASFRGGNGQISLGVDGAGNLLAAAMVSHPAKAGANEGRNYIAVARVTPGGSVSWTMASYNNGTTGVTGTGKPVLNGAGVTIGRLVGLVDVTQGSLNGPSCSAPMIDSGGNVWFLGVWENFLNPTDPFDTALFRAVYDQPTFSYRLERVFSTGRIFRGRNSGRRYQVDFLAIADSNSVSSSTAFSQNICADGWMGYKYATLAPKAPAHLGGLVINAGITYDWDNNNSFDD